MWHELSEIIGDSLSTLHMDGEGQKDETPLRSLGPCRTQPLLGGGSYPAILPHLSPLACQGTAGLPLNKSRDLRRLGPISAKLSLAAKCPAGQQLRPVWQDILG